MICLLTYLAEPVSTKDLQSIAATLGWSTRELNAATDFLAYAEIIETRWISYSDRSYGIEPDFFFHAATSFIKTRGDLLERVRSHVLFDNHDPAILENLLSLATEYSRDRQIKSQTRLKSGKWSAGKRISYNDLSYGIDYMDDTDRKIAQMAQRGHEGPCVRLSKALPLLIGSDRVFGGAYAPHYNIEVIGEKPFVSIKKHGSSERFSSKFIDASDPDLESLKRIVQPFILRRTKAEVLDELPDKTDIIRTVQLSDAEMLAYETMRERVEEDLNNEDKVTVSVLAEITRLRQAACSMSLIDNEWKSGTSKLSELSELVREIVSGGNRVLIFSQFTGFLDMVNAQLERDGVSYFYLNGSTPIRTRSKMVADFQKGEKDAFVVSLKAGGLELNLTGANYVIRLDPWWNPAVESQATDRAYRIGQKQNVTVYHLISAHTIEEKILRLHDAKRRLADNFLEGTSEAHTLSLEELRALCEGR